MAREGMTRRRFLGKAAAAAAGLAVLGLGVQCGATPTPEATQVAPTETPVVKEKPTPAWETPERILFIGDSYTYWSGGVETHLRSLAASADPPLTIETSSETAGGVSLKDHYEGVTFALDEIREGGWDVVVLQDNEQNVAVNEEEFYEYARKLDEEVKKAGARTVFFMPWGWEGEREKGGPITTERQAEGYGKVGAELGARVAPVGLAWERSMQENPEVILYDADGIHPSIHGTYLAACVFYGTLFGQSPVGLSYKPPPWITDEERTFLQRIAWETVQEYNQPAAD